MARILGAQDQSISSKLEDELDGGACNNSLFVSAKHDATHALKILDHICHVPEMQKTRTEVLRSALAEITW